MIRRRETVFAVGRNGIPSYEIIPPLPRWLAPRSRSAISSLMLVAACCERSMEAERASLNAGFDQHSRPSGQTKHPIEQRPAEVRAVFDREFMVA